MPRLINAATQQEPVAGAPIAMHDGRTFIYVRWQEDGAGSAHVFVRAEGERSLEYYRPKAFGLVVRD